MLTGLMTGLLAGGLIASGATPAHARPHVSAERAGTASALRLAPPLVTVGEPSSLVVRLGDGPTGRRVTVERRAGTTWDQVGTTTANAAGRAVLPLDTTALGSQVLRVAGRSAAPVTLEVTAPEDCRPRLALVDRAPTPAARCLAARLDRWKAAGLMGVGQQLNVSSVDYLAPLEALGGRRVSVVGFDLEELARTGEYEFPFLDRALADLASLADRGVVLSASWHATNPHTGGSYADRGWHSLPALLDPTTAEHERFWADFDAKLALLRSLQDAGAAVVFRPFHEANGGWFWWGRPDRATYRTLWAEMQQRAWAAGVHNVVWAYSFAARTWSGIGAPQKLVPARVDLAGLDSYDPEGSPADARDRLAVTGYAAVAKKVSRMALTEVGPEKSADGAWNPAVVSRVARGLAANPLWAMLWFDDAAGRKQLSSLTGGTTWLESCPNAYCYLR
jgi:hypothetical protein